MSIAGYDLFHVDTSLARPIAELQRLDGESRKCMVENGAKHPLGSTELFHLPRRLGGGGLKWVEAEYKATKIKAVTNLYANMDSTIELVRAV